jgi:hypothetical protein
VTLVEMLVTVAMVLIIMTIVVQIFQAATGVLSAAQTIQGLDDELKLLDSTIRADLGGVTARFTPPLDPAQNLGYFEYGENEFADLQGEDSDDYIRFTAKAPAGRPFTGRAFLPPIVPLGALTAAPQATYLGNQPVTVTSDYAEIIYFLRNGNLYRRVLLVAPQLQSAIVPTASNNTIGNNLAYFLDATGALTVPRQFHPAALVGTTNNTVSWQGVNDLSARPASTGPNSDLVTLPGAVASQTIKLNTLGDLTNRENRFAYPRFANDFFDFSSATNVPDGIADDRNNDNVPDYYPSLYFALFGATNQLIFEPGYPAPRSAANTETMAFPYVFPGAYSNPQHLAADQYGWIHSPSPIAVDTARNTYQFDVNELAYLNFMNHNPLDLGDNLATPRFLPTTLNNLQTWWGFPTWRETLSSNWTDPTRRVNDSTALNNVTLKVGFGQPAGLTPLPAGTVPVQDPNGQLLPWGGQPLTVAQGGVFPNNTDFSIIRRNPQLFSDAQGFNAMSVFLSPPGTVPGAGTTVDPLWLVSWEDDLVMTGVRSFDVKAYDNAFGGYVDLGWGDDVRFAGNVMTAGAGAATQPAGQFLFGNADYSGATPNHYPPLVGIQGSPHDYINFTFAHEGRIPPLIEDNRLDAQYPNPTYLNATPPSATAAGGYIPQYAAFTGYSSNVGDDTAGLVRLRRVWDSWSTDYSRAPATGVNGTATGGFPAGPPFSPPIYPSYPPPYPAPLRGIQIQIRVTDPTNQKVKSLTIRHDFTDKL